MVRRSYCLVGGLILKVHVKTAAALIAAAILALLAGSASALNPPTPPLPDGVPTSTQPVDPGDTPVPPVVTVPDNPAPVLPTVTPAHLQPLNGLLLKQRKLQIGLFSQSRSHWAHLLHLRLTPIGIQRLTSLDAANSALAKLKAQSRHLHVRWMRRSIQKNRLAVEHQRLVMGKNPIIRTLAARGSVQEQFLRWRQLARVTYQQFRSPPYEPQLLCIHGGEGSWTDPNPPFWGGLQMNYGFMATYGPWLLRHKGTADHWTPLEQMWVAAKAISSGRGFFPWPNTARVCGLI
jgi:hypothetical protein